MGTPTGTAVAGGSPAARRTPPCMTHAGPSLIARDCSRRLFNGQAATDFNTNSVRSFQALHRTPDHNATFWDKREGCMLPPLQLVHIPKSAGSSMEQWGNTMGYKWGRLRGNWPGGSRPFGSGWQPCSAWHLPPAAFHTLAPASRAEDPYKGYRTLCVVRHPFARAVSQFVFAHCSHARERARYGRRNCSVDALNNYLVQRMARTNASLQAAARLGQIDRVAAEQDCHWLPQVAYAG